jgi:hypothetical protein
MSGSVAGARRNYFNLSSTFRAAYMAAYSNATDGYKGAILEDQGPTMIMDNGWEQALYPTDLLSSMPVQPIALSYFSFTTGAAAQWYSVVSGSYYRMSLHGLGTNSVDFGKDKCLPSSSLGSCTNVGDLMCGPDTETKTKCAKGDFSNDCMFQNATDVCYLNMTTGTADSIEKFGSKSRCVMGTVSGTSKPLCLTVDSYTFGTTTVTFKDSTGALYACTGSDVTVGSVTIKCPTDTTLTTRLGLACSNDCNGNGMCLYSDASTLSAPSGASCFCFWGFSGATCSVRNIREENFMVRNPYNVSGIGIMKMNSLIVSAGALLTGLLAFFYL